MFGDGCALANITAPANLEYTGTAILVDFLCLCFLPSVHLSVNFFDLSAYQLLATYDISSVMYNIALGLHTFKPDDMCTFILTYKYALMYT